MAVNPILQFGLEEEAQMLRNDAKSYANIAEELSASEKLPPGRKVTAPQVSAYFKNVRKDMQSIVKKSNQRLVKVVDRQVNIIDEVQIMYSKSRELLEQMEQTAVDKGYEHINPYQFKAVMSEAREMLNTMIEIQKDINDIENVKFFMQAVIGILKKHAPNVIPILVEELKVNKGTVWLSSQLGSRVD